MHVHPLRNVDESPSDGIRHPANALRSLARTALFSGGPRPAPAGREPYHPTDGSKPSTASHYPMPARLAATGETRSAPPTRSNLNIDTRFLNQRIIGIQPAGCGSRPSTRSSFGTRAGASECPRISVQLSPWRVRPFSDLSARVEGAGTLKGLLLRGAGHPSLPLTTRAPAALPFANSGAVLRHRGAGRRRHQAIGIASATRGGDRASSATSRSDVR